MKATITSIEEIPSIVSLDLVPVLYRAGLVVEFYALDDDEANLRAESIADTVEATA